FVREYLVGLNATQSAIRAGYSARTAYAAGSRLLKDAEVARAIETEQARLAERSALTRERLVSDLARMFADAMAAKNSAAAVRLADLLARLNGWIVERHQVRVIRSITDLTDDELAVLAAEVERKDSTTN
ncbi:MAG: terminase small subunit, partial [Acetobacteraceae bacterium]